MDRPVRPDFADEVTIWHSTDQLEYVLTRDVLLVHNAQGALGADSPIRSVFAASYQCDNALIDVFSLVATGPDGTEVASPQVAVYTLDADGKVCRIDAFMDAAGMAKFPDLSGLGAKDPAGPAIAESRARGRQWYPGMAELQPSTEGRE